MLLLVIVIITAGESKLRHFLFLVYLRTLLSNMLSV